MPSDGFGVGASTVRRSWTANVDARLAVKHLPKHHEEIGFDGRRPRKPFGHLDQDDAVLLLETTLDVIDESGPVVDRTRDRHV